MALTVQQQINIGNVSSIFMSNRLANGKLHGGLLDKNLPLLIYLVRQGLEWLYELDPTNEDLDTIGNYLIAICPDAARAEAAIIGGGAIPTVSAAAVPLPYDWIIGSSTSATEPMKAGDVSVTLTDFIGYNIEFTRGNLVQNTTPPADGFSTYYSWNRATGLFQPLSDQDPFGVPQLGEQFRILPTR